MTNTELIKEANKIGSLLFKIGHLQSEEDLKKEPGLFLPLLLKGLLLVGCKDLMLEVKQYLLSIGVPENKLDEYGKGYFDEEMFDSHIALLKSLDNIEGNEK